MRQTTLIYSSSAQEGLLRFVGPYRATSADLSVSGSYHSHGTRIIAPSTIGTLILYGQNAEKMEITVDETDQLQDANSLDDDE